MTDKEKIKIFIIWQDLEIQGNLQKLNIDGMATLMHLRNVCQGWEGKEILKLVDKLDSGERDEHTTIYTNSENTGVNL